MLSHGRSVRGQRVKLLATLALISVALVPRCIGQLANPATDLSFEVLKIFALGSGDLGLPNTPLVLGGDGYLYGTTLYGTEGSDGYGGIFRLRTDGSGYAILRGNFSAESPFPCGLYPSGRLLEASDGFLYGTTSFISPLSDACGQQIVLFRLEKNGRGYTPLHVFESDTGYLWNHAWGGLIEGADGFLYGTTEIGGAQGYGVVFKVGKDPSLPGSGYKVLHDFGRTADDGRSPQAALLQGSDGALYGTTSAGGTHTTNNGGGTLFKLNPDGTGYTVLFSFGGTNDGCYPVSALIEGQDRKLYGRTLFSGPFTESGPTGGPLIFKLSKGGLGYKVLHRFQPDEDGGESRGSLVEGQDGKLYGTTQDGQVFRLSEDGAAFEVLTRLSNYGGDYPRSGLVQGADGAFYGVTFAGDNTAGIVFKFWPPETPRNLTVNLEGKTAHLRFSGHPGSNYQISRSLDLRVWTVAAAIRIPQQGVYDFTERVIATHAWYRAAWDP